MSIAKIIGDRIRAYRNQKGWSQEYLAEKADVHHTYIGQLERGEKNATIESISKIAGALGVSLSRLFENISIEQQENNPSRAVLCSAAGTACERSKGVGGNSGCADSI